LGGDSSSEWNDLWIYGFEMKEPVITVNGAILPESASMTIRVAIENFAVDLESGLGEDEIGKQICENYKKNIKLIRSLINK
jgi:hypothetical protein